MGECHEIVKKAMQASDNYVTFLESEIQKLKNEVERLHKLQDAWEHVNMPKEIPINYCDLLLKVQELEKYRDFWKASHDNQVKLKSTIINRLDCGDRALKVVALFDKIKNLELALTEIAFGVKKPSERPSGCWTRELTKEEMQEIANKALT